MNARAIAAALGDARRAGRAWRCRCPLHGGRSLVLRDGDGGRVLVTCWAGCDRLAVLAELRHRGLIDGRTHCTPRSMPAPRSAADVSRTARALAIWRRTECGAGSIVERYLKTRGIVLDSWPLSLRFHPRCPRPKDDAGNLLPPLPAMVALIEHIERGPLAVHCTYLRQDGSAKADIETPPNAKAMFGTVAGGAVHFGSPRSGQWLAIGEGIETCLSVATACAMPTWAALSARGIQNLILPREASHVVICADHDASGTGECAARDAAARWLVEGRHVRIAMPPELGSDFNDLLAGRSAAKIKEARHVA
jgi:putative DNA primase/helicase